MDYAGKSTKIQTSGQVLPGGKRKNVDRKAGIMVNLV